MKKTAFFSVVNIATTFVFVSIMLATAPAVQAKTIKIATLSPEGTFWMKSMRSGAKEIRKRTDGRVKFKFYPGGVMGNDANVLRKMRIGQLHGGAVTIGTLAGIAPDVTLYGLPFIFSSHEDAKAIREKTDAMLMKEIEDKGYVNFGFAQGGFTYLMSKEKVNSLDDLKQQKSWVPENSRVGLSVYKNIDVTPISLPLSDVLTGLQTGLINNIITSPIGALALQWHTHVNYVVDLPLNYLAAVMIIDKKVFDKLSKEDQQIVREVMQDVYRKIDAQNQLDNVAARKAMINQGVEFVTLTEDGKKEWYELGDKVIREMIEEYDYNHAVYDSVMAKKPGAPAIH